MRLATSRAICDIRGGGSAASFRVWKNLSIEAASSLAGATRGAAALDPPPDSTPGYWTSERP
jgi:hypothetical protein